MTSRCLNPACGSAQDIPTSSAESRAGIREMKPRVSINRPLERSSIGLPNRNICGRFMFRQKIEKKSQKQADPNQLK